jgi:hypothetical protein
MPPAGGERIERKASRKIHDGYHRPAIGFNTSPRPSKKCQPTTRAAVASATPPIRRYRARHGIEKPARILAKTKKPLTEGIVIVLAERGLLGSYYCRLSKPK